MGQLLVTLDRFEDDKAVLILPDGQNLVISRRLLDSKIKAGNVLALNFSGDASQTSQKENIAKKLLTQIFKKNS